MRKDNRLWFQRLWIPAEILSNVWEEDNWKVGEVGMTVVDIAMLIVLAGFVYVFAYGMTH